MNKWLYFIVHRKIGQETKALSSQVAMLTPPHLTTALQIWLHLCRHPQTEYEFNCWNDRPILSTSLEFKYPTNNYIYQKPSTQPTVLQLSLNHSKRPPFPNKSSQSPPPGHLGAYLSQLRMPHQNTRLGGLNNRKEFSHGSGGWKSKIKVQHGHFLVRTLFLSCRWLPSVFSHAFSWCVRREITNFLVSLIKT